MGQRILLFESDPAFSREVREKFEALGATVDVASDGAQGMDLATAHKPDVILLTIELPGMNGFLVCKKIKKQDGLQTVPLLILSSEATEEVFEQHKKLRTRADDYIHKPVAFADLLERVKQFVPIESNGMGTEGVEEAIELSELEDEEMILVADDSVPPPVEEPNEAELFAEEAVDALVAEDEPAPVPQQQDWSRDARRSIADGMAGTQSPSDAENEPVTAVASAAAAVNQELLRSQHGSQQLQARVTRLEAELAQAERRAKDAEQELQNAKQRATTAERSLADAGKKGSISSREFLDLREQLNRKDRELLGLRDQVSLRDKQVIEASDKNLTFERELADQSDRYVELQGELEKAQAIAETLQQDKDGAKKRLEDFRARLERSEHRQKELSDELSGIKLVTQREREAAEAVQKEAQEELRRQHVAVLEALRRGHAEELAEQRDERAVAIAAVKEQAEEEKQRALSLLRSELQAQTEQRVAEQQQQHETIVSQALAAHESELASTRTNLEQRHATELRQSGEKHQQELGRVGRALGELENKVQLLEEQLEEAETARNDANARLAKATSERDQKAERVDELQARIDHLSAKRAAEEQLFERARKALAIGLSLLEEQKNGAGDEQSEG
jgi:CheY-like chemotaxis protein/chromosome segregation ATPase